MAGNVAMAEGYKYRIILEGEGKKPLMMVSDLFEDKERAENACKEMSRTLADVRHADVFKYEELESKGDGLCCRIGFLKGGSLQSHGISDDMECDLDFHMFGYIEKLDYPLAFVKIFKNPYIKFGVGKI